MARQAPVPHTASRAGGADRRTVIRCPRLRPWRRSRSSGSAVRPTLNSWREDPVHRLCCRGSFWAYFGKLLLTHRFSVVAGTFPVTPAPWAGELLTPSRDAHHVGVTLRA